MSKKEMNHEELENFINEGFGDTIKKLAKKTAKAAKSAALASVDRGRSMRGADSKHDTSGDPLKAFVAGWKGLEAPKGGIFKGQKDPNKYIQGLKEIVEFYEKVTHVDPAKNQNIREAVSDLKKAQSALEQLMSAASSAEPQQGSEQEPENNV